MEACKAGWLKNSFPFCIEIINYTSVSKSAGDKTVSSDGKVTIPWTITYNEWSGYNASNSTINDSIGESSRQNMKYSGEGITIQRYELVNGNYSPKGEPQNIAWKDLKSHSDSEWTYQFGTEDKAYKYVISYTTEVDMSNKNANVVVSNDTSGGSDGKGDTSHANTQVDVLPGRDFKAEKDGSLTIDKNGKRSITWTITLTAPADGADTAYVKDTVPYIYVADKNETVYELPNAEPVVDGLVDGKEHFVYQKTATGFIIEFYKSDSQKGLLPSSATPKAPRTITITYTSDVNQDWYDAYKTYDDYRIEHTNKGDFYVNDESKGFTTTVRVKELNKIINKYWDNQCSEDKAGDKLLYYKFSIDITGIDTAKTTVIKDTFDTSHFVEYAESNNDSKYQFKLYSGDQYNTNTYLATLTPEVLTDSNGNKTGIQFRLTSVDFKNVKSGDSHYKIYYCLKFKDKAALEEVQKTLFQV